MGGPYDFVPRVLVFAALAFSNLLSCAPPTTSDASARGLDPVAEQDGTVRTAASLPSMQQAPSKRGNNTYKSMAVTASSW